jgi:hypothetical protein
MWLRENIVKVGDSGAVHTNPLVPALIAGLTRNPLPIVNAKLLVINY